MIIFMACCIDLQTMYTATWTPEQGWVRGQLQPYGPLPMMPSAQVLNYGQSVFEGMKAQRSAKDRIVLFRWVDATLSRCKAASDALPACVPASCTWSMMCPHCACCRPDQNAARMEAGAQRLSMPPVPKDMFVDAVKSMVAANADFVSVI
jgi:branched-chain amino acid aminotransferase